ncbi:hypothetical protein TUM12370_17650 [Salmonella enterica subsp. enterica serovar Choleraesuis]|nr:hypothetical protein TUM12370_17650 [Salmonella enterica subsp. enterica serovar Choleraesuis]
MGPLFALVMTVGMTNGDFQDVVLGVYDTEKQCQQAGYEQRVTADCYPVERIIPAGEVPAETLADTEGK